MVAPKPRPASTCASWRHYRSEQTCLTYWAPDPRTCSLDPHKAEESHKYLATTAILQSLADPTDYSEALLAPSEADVLDAAWIRHRAASSSHAAMRHAAHHPSIDVEEDLHEIVCEVARLVRSGNAPSRRLVTP